MTDLSGYDAAYPPADPPADQVVFGYLGGDTPNVWTPAEWAAQKARYRVGIWTRSDPVGAAQGTTEGRAAVAAWRALGADGGTLLVLDLETAVNAAYVTAFDAEIVAGGCKVAAYGSTATLFKNPRPSGGFFPASITDTAHLYPGTLLTQYAFESGWDDDEVAGSLVGSLWDTQGGTEMALTQTDAELIATTLLNTPIARAGNTAAGAEKGNTSLFEVLAWSDAGLQGTHDLMQVVEGTVEKISAPVVDAAELASALAGNGAFVNALAAAVVAQIGADLKPAPTE
jgi:hypothetical protein